MQLKMALQCYLVFSQYYSELFLTILNIYPGIHIRDVLVFRLIKIQKEILQIESEYKLLVKRLNSL